MLADRRDTLVLGALLRGPLVWLTEEELLDIVWALPRADDAPDDLPRLDLGVAPEAIENALAPDIYGESPGVAAQGARNGRRNRQSASRPRQKWPDADVLSLE